MKVTQHVTTTTTMFPQKHLNAMIICVYISIKTLHNDSLSKLTSFGSIQLFVFTNMNCKQLETEWAEIITSWELREFYHFIHPQIRLKVYTEHKRHI